MDDSTIYKSEIKVIEKNGKKISQVDVPIQFEGFSYLIRYVKTEMPDIERGPYKVELILCNDFLIYMTDLKSDDIIGGFSNLTSGTPPKQIQEVNLTYEFGKSKVPKTLKLTFNVKNGIIRSIIVTFSDEPSESIVDITLNLLNPILDGITFRKKIPLKICRIDFYHIPSSFLIYSLITVPYLHKYDLEEDDFLFANSVSKSLIFVIRLYREAKNSNNSHYRFLCLFKASEELINVRNKNSCIAKNNNQKISRTKVVVPDNRITKLFFNENIGTNFDGFVNNVLRKKYRDNIAHLNFDDKERICVTPCEIHHDIEAAIMVLDDMLHQAIEIEMDFIKPNLK